MKRFNDEKVGVWIDNKMYVASLCGICQEVVITYDPQQVHSLRRFNKGERVPVCKTCFQKWNKIHRLKKGLQPIRFNEKAYVDEQKYPKEKNK